MKGTHFWGKKMVFECSLQKQSRKFKSESYSPILNLKADLPASYPILQGKKIFFPIMQIKAYLTSKLSSLWKS